MRHGQLSDDEGTAEVDIDRVVPFFETDVKDVTRPLPVAGVDDQNVWMLAMLLLDFVKQTLEIVFFTNIALVG